jgi:hypothetical protein
MKILHSPHRPVEDFEDNKRKRQENFQGREASFNASWRLSASTGYLRAQSWERLRALNCPDLNANNISGRLCRARSSSKNHGDNSGNMPCGVVVHNHFVHRNRIKKGNRPDPPGIICCAAFARSSLRRNVPYASFVAPFSYGIYV